MRLLRRSTHLFLIALFCTAALTPAFAEDATAIKQVLADQQAAWNEGDIDTFMHGYKNSPETTFIGKNIRYGYEPILENYKRNFATCDTMGTLDFSEVTVKMLGKHYAVVTGKFHVARSAAAGGDLSGVYSLIFQREPEGWRIILDHSSSS